MARLIGFRQAKQATAASEKNIVDLVVKSYLNRTQYGEFNTVEEVDGAINALKGLPQTLDVQERIADLENTKLKISAKLNDLLMEKNIFDSDLNEALTEATRANFQNPKQMIGSYAAILGDAFERYDTDIYNNVFKRYGTIDKVPAEVIDYRKKLEDKAKLYMNVFNSYNFVDPDTNEVGLLEPDAFAVVVDTNPASGKITRMELVPSGEVNRDIYMRTDTPLQVMEGMLSKKLPIYLRTFDGGISEFGKPVRSSVLGGFVYSGVDTAAKKDDVGTLGVGELKVQKEGEGFFKGLGRALVPKWFGWEENVFGRAQKDVAQNLRDDGVLLKNFQFDSADIPNGAVLRMGSRIFYSTDQNNEVLEISGKNEEAKLKNLKKYLQGVGKDPKIANMPYFVDRSFLVAPDGSSRVKGTIDENYFAPVSPSTQSVVGASTVAPILTPQEIPQDTFFSSRQQSFETKTSTPAVMPAKESSGGFPSIPDIIEKGKSFFRNKLGIG